jgi:hypothetical protein
MAALVKKDDISDDITIEQICDGIDDEQLTRIIRDPMNHSTPSATVFDNLITQLNDYVEKGTGTKTGCNQKRYKDDIFLKEKDKECHYPHFHQYTIDDDLEYSWHVERSDSKGSIHYLDGNTPKFRISIYQACKLCIKNKFPGLHYFLLYLGGIISPEIRIKINFEILKREQLRGMILDTVSFDRLIDHCEFDKETAVIPLRKRFKKVIASILFNHYLARPEKWLSSRIPNGRNPNMARDPPEFISPLLPPALPRRVTVEEDGHALVIRSIDHFCEVVNSYIGLFDVELAKINTKINTYTNVQDIVAPDDPREILKHKKNLRKWITNAVMQELVDLKLTNSQDNYYLPNRNMVSRMRDITSYATEHVIQNLKDEKLNIPNFSYYVCTSFYLEKNSDPIMWGTLSNVYHRVDKINRLKELYPDTDGGVNYTDRNVDSFLIILDSSKWNQYDDNFIPLENDYLLFSGRTKKTRPPRREDKKKSGKRR